MSVYLSIHLYIYTYIYIRLTLHPCNDECAQSAETQRFRIRCIPTDVLTNPGSYMYLYLYVYIYLHIYIYIYSPCTPDAECQPNSEFGLTLKCALQLLSNRHM